MADVGDHTKDKKRKHKVFRKPERELETFMPDSMRTPIIPGFGKSSYAPKSSTYAGFAFDNSQNDYDKRGKGYYYDKKSGSYHDKKSGYHSEWEKKSFYASDDWDKRNDRSDWEKHGSYNSSNKGSQGFIDSGRPPGNRTEEMSPTMVTPVILSRVKASSESKGSVAEASTIVTTPKKESELAVSVAPIAAPLSVAASPQQYQIASKPAAGLEASVVPESVMKYPAKLLDETLNVCDDLSSFLLDQTQFFVVSIVGTQGTGKSTLASLLADTNLNVKLFKTFLFRSENLEQIMTGSHCTNGIDVYVTKDRLIILDLQPLLSPSVMDYGILQERVFESGSAENTMEIETLQLLTYSMSISHAVMVVQDYTIDPNIIRLLQTCEMMKPTSGGFATSGSSSRVTIGGEDVQNSFPHVVFVHNRVQSQHFSPSFMKNLQNVYHQSFSGSFLERESRIGSCNGVLVPPMASTSCSDLFNLFIIPDFNQESPVNFQESIKEMRRQLLSLRRLPLTHVSLTEKTWYQYACRMWESVRKSSLCIEYSRLLP